MKNFHNQEGCVKQVETVTCTQTSTFIKASINCIWKEQWNVKGVEVSQVGVY